MPSAVTYGLRLSLPGMRLPASTRRMHRSHTKPTDAPKGKWGVDEP